MTEEKWVVEYRDVREGRDLTSPTKTSKQTALSYARDLIRDHRMIYRIVGQTSSSTKRPLSNGPRTIRNKTAANVGPSQIAASPFVLYAGALGHR
jgi:hypothetical protein